MQDTWFWQVIIGCVENTEEEYIKALLRDYNPNKWDMKEFLKKFKELKQSTTNNRG